MPDTEKPPGRDTPEGQRPETDRKKMTPLYAHVTETRLDLRNAGDLELARALAEVEHAAPGRRIELVVGTRRPPSAWGWVSAATSASVRIIADDAATAEAWTDAP